MRHNTMWTLKLLDNGVIYYFDCEEDCKSTAFFYHDHGHPTAIYAPLYY